MGWEDPLELETAIHPSTIAWKISWTEEPAGLQSMGLQSQTRLNEFACTIDCHCQIMSILILESNLNLDHLPEKYRENNNS